MRRNTLITLGVSTIFGGLAIVLARGWINTAMENQYERTRPTPISQARPKIKTRPILVADMPLNFGDILTQQHVRLVEYPENAIPEGSFSDFNLLFQDSHKPNTVLKQMAANEPILAFKLSGPGGRATLSGLLVDNMRAVSIQVNAVTGVAGFIQPGDTVDVFYIEEMEQEKTNLSPRELALGKESAKTHYKSTTLLQNIKILGTDQRSETIDNRVEIVRTVTLEVTLQQAQSISLATRAGELSLSLRQTGATNISNSVVMSSKSLSSSLSTRTHKPKTSRPPARRTPRAKETGVASIVVIRGDKIDQVSVFKDTQQTLTLAGG